MKIEFLLLTILFLIPIVSSSPSDCTAYGCLVSSSPSDCTAYGCLVNLPKGDTINILVNYTSSYNDTYNAFTGLNNATIWTAINSFSGGGNASWNQTRANELYIGISNISVNGLIGQNASLWLEALNKFNITYESFTGLNNGTIWTAINNRATSTNVSSSYVPYRGALDNVNISDKNFTTSGFSGLGYVSPAAYIDTIAPATGTFAFITPSIRIRQGNVPTQRYWDTVIQNNVPITEVAMQDIAYNNGAVSAYGLFLSSSGKIGVGNWSGLSASAANTFKSPGFGIALPAINTSSEFGYILVDPATTRLRIMATSNTTVFTLNSDAVQILHLANANGGGDLALASRGSSIATSIQFWTGNGSRLYEVARFNGTGYFAIGTTTPVEKLTVIGNANISGTTTSAYKAANGTLGYSGTCTILGLTSIVVKDGIILGCS